MLVTFTQKAKALKHNQICSYKDAAVNHSNFLCLLSILVSVLFQNWTWNRLAFACFYSQSQAAPADYCVDSRESFMFLRKLQLSRQMPIVSRQSHCYFLGSLKWSYYTYTSWVFFTVHYISVCIIKLTSWRKAIVSFFRKFCMKNITLAIQLKIATHFIIF